MLKKRRIVLRALGGFAWFLVVCGIMLIAAAFLNEPPAGQAVNSGGVSVEGGEVVMEIGDGESADSVGARLEAAGLIKTRFLWRALCRADGRYLKAGVYGFKEGLPLTAIRGVFIAGRQLLVKVTIPEGSTIKKTAAIFEAEGVCRAEDFVAAARDEGLLHEYRVPGKTMEGFLYPDTYRVNKRYPAVRLVRMMADNFYEKLGALGTAEAGLTPEELFRKVILASIVEREYRLEREAPLIAGVFENRLQRGMRLESCATVEYVITEIEGRPHPRRIYNRDLEVQSPYNTYLQSGLPPGPIASAGRAALAAVFSPDKNEYLFFRIADPAQGRHYFSKTFDDHIRAGQLVTKF
ncbi:MAG: endolytic transglycosylase MltG [Spirochaetaceae bacterium]|jgi:UPF0755 protein|nr:endolytic transglycosylase MltG [Spirochaetaceae bacterium]